MTDITNDTIDYYNAEIKRLIDEIEGNQETKSAKGSSAWVDDILNDFDDFNKAIDEMSKVPEGYKLTDEEERYLVHKYDTRYNDAEISSFGTYGSIKIPDYEGWDTGGLDIFEVAEFLKNCGFMYSIDYFGDYYILTYSATPQLYDKLEKNRNRGERL